jgi:hypothetical protein
MVSNSGLRLPRLKVSPSVLASVFRTTREGTGLPSPIIFMISFLMAACCGGRLSPDSACTASRSSLTKFRRKRSCCSVGRACSLGVSSSGMLEAGKAVVVVSLGAVPSAEDIWWSADAYQVSGRLRRHASCFDCSATNPPRVVKGMEGDCQSGGITPQRLLRRLGVFADNFRNFARITASTSLMRSQTPRRAATGAVARALLVRPLSCSAALGSGHNRWSKIKHDKGKEDAIKSRARTILSEELIMASKRMCLYLNCALD